eukprot:6491476-Amphidinium_carterae.3
MGGGCWTPLSLSWGDGFLGQLGRSGLHDSIYLDADTGSNCSGWMDLLPPDWGGNEVRVPTTMNSERSSGVFVPDDPPTFVNASPPEATRAEDARVAERNAEVPHAEAREAGREACESAAPQPVGVSYAAVDTCSNFGNSQGQINLHHKGEGEIIIGFQNVLSLDATEWRECAEKGLNETVRLKWIAKKAEVKEVDIFGMVETRMPEDAQFFMEKYLAVGFRAVGGRDGQMVLLHLNLRPQLLWKEAISERISRVKVVLAKVPVLIVLAHGPIAAAPPEAHDEFRAQLEAALSTAREAGDSVVLLADLNARFRGCQRFESIGSMASSDPVVGDEQRTENLARILAQQGIRLVNTFLHHQSPHTWHHASGFAAQIDFIGLSRYISGCARMVTIDPREGWASTCMSDHDVVMAVLCDGWKDDGLQQKKKRPKPKAKVLHTFVNEEHRKRFVESFAAYRKLAGTPCGPAFNKFSSLINDALQVLNETSPQICKRPRKEWISDECWKSVTKVAGLRATLKRATDAWVASLATRAWSVWKAAVIQDSEGSGSGFIEWSVRRFCMRCAVFTALRVMRRLSKRDRKLWMQQECAELQKMAASGRIKEYHAKLNRLTKKKTIQHGVLMSKKGKKAYSNKEVAQEVVGALKSSASGKASPDPVSIDVLKAIGQDATPLLANMYTHFLRTSTVPTTFRGGVIIPVHKKGAWGEPSNFRPICLMNNAAKIFNRIILERLGLMDTEPTQFAGPGSSVEFPLLCCGMLLQHLRRHNVGAAFLFLDVQQAYDNVSRSLLFGDPAEIARCAEEGEDILPSGIPYSRAALIAERFLGELPKLAQMGVSQELMDVVRSSNTQTWLQMTRTHGGRTIMNDRGIRQGCRLAPFLFCCFHSIATRRLRERMDSAGILMRLPISPTLCGVDDDAGTVMEVSNLSFVDDLLTPVWSKDPVLLLAMAATLARIVIHTFEEIGLPVNMKPQKTEMLLAIRGPRAKDLYEGLRFDGDVCSEPGPVLVYDRDAIGGPRSIRIAKHYKYLGKLVTPTGSQLKENRARAGQAMTAVKELKKVFDTVGLSAATKVNTLILKVMSILLFGVHVLMKMTGPEYKVLNTCYMGAIRTVAGERWGAKHISTDEEVLARVRLPTLAQQIVARRLVFWPKIFLHRSPLASAEFQRHCQELASWPKPSEESIGTWKNGALEWGSRWALMARQFGKTHKSESNKDEAGKNRTNGDSSTYCPSIVPQKLKDVTQDERQDGRQGVPDVRHGDGSVNTEQSRSLLEQAVAEALDEHFLEWSKEHGDTSAGPSTASHIEGHDGEALHSPPDLCADNQACTEGDVMDSEELDVQEKSALEKA